MSAGLIKHYQPLFIVILLLLDNVIVIFLHASAGYTASYLKVVRTSS